MEGQEIRFEQILKEMNMTPIDYFINLKNITEKMVLNLAEPKNKIIEFDKTEGIYIIVLIPLLYFLIVGVIVVFLIWCIKHTEFSPTGINSASQCELRISVKTKAEGEDGSFARNGRNMVADVRQINLPRNSVSSGMNVDLINRSRDSLSSRVSTASYEVLRVDDLKLDSRNYAEENVFTQADQNMIVSTRSTGSRTIAVTGVIATRHSLASTILTMSPDSLHGPVSRHSLEKLSRDSLRASMESQKVRWTGRGDILPDDRYSLNELGAALSQQKTCRNFGMNLTGENSSDHHDVCTNYFDQSSYFEDPLVENLQNKFEESPTIETEDPAMERENALRLFRLMEYLSAQSNTEQDLSNYMIELADRQWLQQKDFEYVELSNDTETKTFSLPPLPPNQVSRQSASTTGSRYPRDRSAVYSVSDQERLSTQDSSMGSDSLSLPSSVAKFHASKLGRQPSLNAGYPLVNAASLFSFQSSESRLDNMSDPLTDNTSTHGQVGSYSEVNCSNLSTASQNTHDNPEEESETIGAGMARRGEDKEMTSPLINNIERASFDYEKHSSDLVKPGKVSVELRLQEFGFIKKCGRKSFIVDASTDKFFERNSSPTEERTHDASLYPDLNKKTENSESTRRELFRPSHAQSSTYFLRHQQFSLNDLAINSCQDSDSQIMHDDIAFNNKIDAGIITKNKVDEVFEVHGTDIIEENESSGSHEVNDIVEENESSGSHEVNNHFEDNDPFRVTVKSQNRSNKSMTKSPESDSSKSNSAKKSTKTELIKNTLISKVKEVGARGRLRRERSSLISLEKLHSVTKKTWKTSISPLSSHSTGSSEKKKTKPRNKSSPPILGLRCDKFASSTDVTQPLVSKEREQSAFTKENNSFSNATFQDDFDDTKKVDASNFVKDFGTGSQS